MIYIVATPIGNLKDISLRALEVLKKADYILAEDTRHTKILLNNYNIATKIISYHKFNEKKRTTELKDLLKEGRSLALVSDAGTPCISDPGSFIIDEAIKNNIEIISIPGPSAMTTILSLSGISYKDRIISFVGFLPHTKNKKQKILLNEIQKGNIAVFFDSPNRVLETLDVIKNISDKVEVIIGRELTKKHEEVIRFESTQIPKITLKGEFVVLINPPKLNEKEKDLGSLNANKISQILANYLNIEKDKAYKELIKLKEINSSS